MIDPTEPSQIPEQYRSVLEQIKQRVVSAQLKATTSVNTELIRLYWEVGAAILKRQQESAWGSQIIEKLSRDLRSAFPGMKGFSFRNVKYMVQFAKEHPNFPFGQQAAAQIPWGHNMLLLDKISDTKTREWYIKKTIENGWSRTVLDHWIDSGLHERHGKAITNFESTLPLPQSDLAHETLKDPYSFDFLTLRERFNEKELENGLIDHIQRFLLELGAGFAYVGRQINLHIGNQDFFIDLLFYHLKLRCYVVVELKAVAFQPEHAGKMNFYLSAVDDLMKHKDDNPTIGLLLCKTKDKVIVEYALRDIKKPLGVAEYETKIVESLPNNLRGSLPTIEEIELEFEGK